MEKQLVVFKLNNEYFGINIRSVEGIIKMPAITPVPHAPQDVVGVTNLRGAILPVYDLQQRFWGYPHRGNGDTRVVIVFTPEGKVGFIVQAVSEVLIVDDARIEDAPSIVASVSAEFIQGIARLDSKLVILLDIENVIKMEEKDRIYGAPQALLQPA